MPVRMTDIPPQMPSGVKKLDIEASDIIGEIDFNADLDLSTVLPAETPAESRDFTQVGQILQKMFSLKVQIEETTAEPPIKDVDLPAEKPMIAEVSLGSPPHMPVKEILVRTKVEPTDAADTEPQTEVITPAETSFINRTSNSDSTLIVDKNPPISKIPLDTKLQRNAHVTEHSGSKTPEKNLDAKLTPAQPEVNFPRDTAPTPPDTVNAKSPESKLQTTVEAPRDFGEFTASISDKPQMQRPFSPAMPAVQPAAIRPQTAEAKIVSQISTAISNTSKDTVEIRLDPPELGRVIISITQTDSGLSATIVSEKPEISDLLRRHAELLSRELSKSGFNEASLEFSHRDRRQNQSAFEEAKSQFSSGSPEQIEVHSSLEKVLRSNSGSLDIRL